MRRIVRMIIKIFFFFFFYIALEDAPVWGAFKLSEELVSGRFFSVFKVHAIVFGLMAAIFLPLMLGFGLIGLEGVYRSIIFRILIALVVPLLLGIYYFLFCWLKETKAVAGTIVVNEKK